MGASGLGRPAEPNLCSIFLSGLKYVVLWYIELYRNTAGLRHGSNTDVGERATVRGEQDGKSRSRSDKHVQSRWTHQPAYSLGFTAS